MNYQSKEEDMVANPIEKSLYLPRLAKMTKKERFTDKEMFFEFRLMTTLISITGRASLWNYRFMESERHRYR